MPQGIFSRDGQVVHTAILEARDPEDILQVLDAASGRISPSLLAQMMELPPLADSSVEYRLEQLLEQAHALQVKDRMSAVLMAYSGGLVEQGNRMGRELLEMMGRMEGGLTGGFQYSKCLDDPAPSDDEQNIPSIVRGFIYPGGMSCLAGDGGIGKSWLAIHLGLCVATGEFWLGMQCRAPKRVGYVCLEMPGGAVRHRIKLLTGGKFPKEARERFHYITKGELGRAVDILDAKFHLALSSWVAEKKLDLVIVDPLMNTHCVNENDTMEMGQVMRALSTIGCAVLILHHVSKGDGKSRGSKVIHDWVDGIMRLSEDADGLVIGWEKRSRFAAVGGDFRLEMRLGETMQIERLN